MLIQVHDELVFETKRARADEFAEIVKTEMQNAVKLDVRLRVDVATGDTWLDTK